ncbi:hypothetical protein EDB80DRAFT_351794 [Ilyonectria destructans]|nr:hypothetical protein EDB80DRAFT_351794 [Ilyonectria destructans]
MADVFGIVAGLWSVAALFNCVDCFEYIGRDCERCQLTGFVRYLERKLRGPQRSLKHRLRIAQAIFC